MHMISMHMILSIIHIQLFQFWVYACAIWKSCSSVVFADVLSSSVNQIDDDTLEAVLIFSINLTWKNFMKNLSSKIHLSFLLENFNDYVTYGYISVSLCISSTSHYVGKKARKCSSNIWGNYGGQVFRKFYMKLLTMKYEAT
jgi:hypothetical protein